MTSALAITIIASALADRWIRYYIASGLLMPGSFFLSSQSHLQELSVIGLFPNDHPLMIVLIVMALAAILGVAFFQWNADRRVTTRTLALLAIFFGGVNNLIDRIVWRGVWDYWSVSLKGNTMGFNWSDVMIVMASIYLFFRGRQKIAKIRN